MGRIIAFVVVSIGLLGCLVVILLGSLKTTTVESNVALLSVSVVLVALAVLLQEARR